MQGETEHVKDIVTIEIERVQYIEETLNNMIRTVIYGEVQGLRWCKADNPSQLNHCVYSHNMDTYTAGSETKSPDPQKPWISN